MAKKNKAKERRMASARERADKHKSGFESNAIALPEGASFYSMKEGSHKLEIVPFEAGKSNPYAPEGDLYYERTYYVHRGIGPDEGTYVCSRKTFGKKCYLCEYRQKLSQDPDADEEQLKALAPKERQLFNIYDHKQPDKGVQVLDMSFHLFGRMLDKKIRNGEEGEYDAFFDPEDGYYLRIGAEENSFQGRKFVEVADIEFKKRKESLDEEILSQAVCLDDCIKEMDYDELRKVFLQEDDDDDDDDKPAKKPGKAKPAGKDKDAKKPGKKPKQTELTADELGLEVGDDVEHDDYGICEIVKISKDGTSLTLEDEDGQKHSAIGCDEVSVAELEEGDEEPEEEEPEEDEEEPDEDDEDYEEEEEPEEEEEEEEPPRRRGPGRPKKNPPKTRAAVEDEDDDDDDDPPPAKRPRGRPPKKK